MKPTLVFVALGLAAAAATSTKRRPPRACPLPGVRVVFIGDSNGVGLAGEGFGEPLAKLARGCGTPFTADVKGGMGAPFFAPRVPTLLEQHRPTLLLVNLGPNDYRRDDPEHVGEAIGEIVGAAAERGVQVVWVSPPKMGPPADVDQIGVQDMWRSALKTVGGLEYKTPLPPDAKDKIHYTMTGYAQLAKAIWAFVAERARA